VHTHKADLWDNPYIAVLLVPPLVRRFLINYCRELHYTTAMTGASLVAVNCSFDALESGYTREVSVV